ncbi:MAG TPA: hypothetical protein VNI56_03160, partial [Xanthomonadaceae bacterium]|nr:hypothetical protein [Xanthomonadaceae bacterium]
ARAYAAVAIASVLLDTYASLSPEEHQRRVAYTRKALQLSPDLGEAHIANATLLQSMRDIAGANREYARGIELAPGYANGFMWYAEFLMFELGEVEQSLRMYDRALALDPLSPIVRNEHANGLALAGRVDAALAEIAALLEDHPTLAPAHGLRARILESQGDLVGALRALRAQQQHDPDAVGRGLHRCYTLAAFGALDEAGSCIEAYKERFPAKEDALGAQVSLTALRADFATALALLMQRPHPDQWERAYLLMANGRDAEALALLKTLVPELFDTPAERATANFPGDIVMVGSTLLRTGATAHGQALLRRALQVNARYQHGQLHLGRGWWDVVARAQLGDIPGACVALKAAVDSGFYRDIPELDADPLAAPVRGDPCYSQVLAPARAKAAAQVAAARKAGLL